MTHTIPDQFIDSVSEDAFFWLVKLCPSGNTKTSSLVRESDTESGDSVTQISGLMGDNVQITLLNNWIGALSAFR